MKDSPYKGCSSRGNEGAPDFLKNMVASGFVKEIIGIIKIEVSLRRVRPDHGILSRSDGKRDGCNCGVKSWKFSSQLVWSIPSIVSDPTAKALIQRNTWWISTDISAPVIMPYLYASAIPNYPFSMKFYDGK